MVVLKKTAMRFSRKSSWKILMLRVLSATGSVSAVVVTLPPAVALTLYANQLSGAERNRMLFLLLGYWCGTQVVEPTTVWLWIVVTPVELLLLVPLRLAVTLWWPVPLIAFPLGSRS